MENKLNQILKNQATILLCLSDAGEDLGMELDTHYFLGVRMEETREILKPSSADEESKAFKEEQAKEIEVDDAKTEESA